MAREVYADLDVNGNKIVNVAATDAANKQYVLDNAGGGGGGEYSYAY